MGSQDIFAQEARYPAWFRAMPEPQQALWAVGYARGYDALSAGMDSARADARERLRRNRGMVLRGEKLYESAPGLQMSFEGARFTRRTLADTLKLVVYADSLTAGGMTLVLAAWPAPDSLLGGLASGGQGSGRHSLSRQGPDGPSKQALSEQISSEQAPFSDMPPAWTEGETTGKTSGSGRLQAVGRAPRYYYLENSWRRAEKRARRQLAFRAASEISRLEKSAEDWRHAVTSIGTEARLRGVQALARWADGETCYVLVEGAVEETLIGRDGPP